MVASQQGKKIKHKTGKHLRSLILAVCNHNLTTVFFFICGVPACSQSRSKSLTYKLINWRSTYGEFYASICLK